jgi:hypothetical protein
MEACDGRVVVEMGFLRFVVWKDKEVDSLVVGRLRARENWTR